MLIEILVAEGCPGEESAIRLVATAAARLGVTPVVNLLDAGALGDATAETLAGSPIIRVNGHVVAMVDAPNGVMDERIVFDAMALAAELDRRVSG